MHPKLRPLVALPADERRELKLVLFDIDDTLTTGGRLASEAYDVIEDMKNPGLVSVAITGRPAG